MKRPFDGVIFDMDGTLIEQRLDFAAIRAELGVGSEEGILEALQRRPDADRRAATRRLEEYELAAAEQAALMPGAREMLGHIVAAGLRTALLTRSAQAAMETVLRRHGLAFDLAWSRAAGAIKPEPDGVLAACRQLQIEPARTCCVGDFLHDVRAANAAGAVSVLLDERGDCPFACEADRVIRSLDELGDILEI